MAVRIRLPAHKLNQKKKTVMRKNRTFRLCIALAAALSACLLSFIYFTVKRTSRFIVRRYSFIVSCVITLCSAGMLYSSLVTESPVRGAWVTACVGMLSLAVSANYYIWKED